MQLFRTSTFLRWVLRADAATCMAIGLLMVFGSNLLEQFLGLPTELSRYAGFSLLPFAAFLVYLAGREHLSLPAIWAVIVINTLWTIDSLLLLLGGWVEPTGLGHALIIFQASGVALFAALEYFGLRRSVMAMV